MNKQQEEWKERVSAILVQLTDEMDYQDTPEQLAAFTEAVESIYSLLLQARKEAREEVLEELKSTEKILENRSVLFEYIPECEVHGKYCVPHAIKWINSIQKKSKFLIEIIASDTNGTFTSPKPATVLFNAIKKTLDHIAKKNNWKV